MGNRQATLTDQQLEDYQDCTYFTRNDILRCQKRFSQLHSDLPKVMLDNEANIARAPLNRLEKMPELKENPFNRRICKVFTEDKSGCLTFNEFLNMFSAFSENAPREMKLHYAFKIFDFDGDNTLGMQDLKSALYALTRDGLNKDEVNMVCEKILEESDIDDDSCLNFMEFEHAIARAPDFMTNFRMKI